MILTGERMTAQRAKELGIVQEIHPVEKLHEAMMTLAKNMATNSIYTLMIQKQSISFAFEHNGGAVSKYEKARNISLHSLPGKQEGVTAFIEKRKPDYTGK